MQSPRSYGHFEMRLTYEGLSVPKLWALKKNIFRTCRKLNLKVTATRTPCSLQAVSLIHSPQHSIHTNFHTISPGLFTGGISAIPGPSHSLTTLTPKLATYRRSATALSLADHISHHSQITGHCCKRSQFISEESDRWQC